MVRIKYDMALMGYISIFERLTRTKLKDCFASEDMATFIVQPNEIAKAIGKSGKNAKDLERILKKKVRIVEFSEDVTQFIRNLIYPLRADEIAKSEDEKLITVKSSDFGTKSMLIGRNATNLRATEEIVKRYFDINEIKVV